MCASVGAIIPVRTGISSNTHGYPTGISPNTHGYSTGISPNTHGYPTGISSNTHGYPTGISSNTHGYPGSYIMSTTGILRVFIFRPPSNYVLGYWIVKKQNPRVGIYDIQFFILEDPRVWDTRGPRFFALRAGT